MKGDKTMKKAGNILLGIILIIMEETHCGITHIDIFFDGWWTLFIIIPCFIGLFKDDEKTGSIIGILVGVALLLACQDVIDFDLIWKLALPVILVIIGISLVFKDIFNSKLNGKIKELNKNNEKNNGGCAIFSGQDLNFEGEKFKGTSLTAIFGGIKCDLRKAIIEDDIVINTTSIFGGVEIFVPDDVKVKVKSTSIFGGVDDKKENKIEKEEFHTIYINAICVFGGADIR